MNNRIAHYENKLKYEIDSYDLYEGLNAGEDIVVVDARSSEAYAERHIPGAIKPAAPDDGCEEHVPAGQRQRST